MSFSVMVGAISVLLKNRTMAIMRTLIYKRTHTGDPDRMGCFGIERCMGSVRHRSFEAVIGVGGIGKEPNSCGIAEKVTWIGIGASEAGVGDDGCPLIVFRRFKLLDENGPELRDKAPRLAERLLRKYGARTLKVDSQENEEVRRLLAMAKKSPPSAMVSQLVSQRTRKKCQGRKTPRC